MLELGVIEPANGPWSSPMVLIKKKDGSVRFCVDYRRLNDVTVKDVYPLPRIDDVLDRLGGAKFFTTLDLYKGYWQVPMAEADRPKTAFVTPDGLFQFKRMSFGLQRSSVLSADDGHNFRATQVEDLPRVYGRHPHLLLVFQAAFRAACARYASDPASWAASTNSKVSFCKRSDEVLGPHHQRGRHRPGPG